MLDLNKIGFIENESKEHPDSKSMKAHFEWSTVMHVSNREIDKPKVRDHVRNELKHRFHWMAYGGLLPRFFELEAFARKYSPPSEWHRIEQLAGELKALLSEDFKDEQSIVAECKPHPREEYWLSVKTAVEPLPFDVRVAIIQMIVLKVGPAPDSMHEAIMRLMIE